MQPVIRAFKKVLQDRYGDRLVRFIVFGSTVRGEATPESDIDILITLKGTVDWKLEQAIVRLANRIEMEYDIILDLKVFSEDDIQNTLLGATPFIETVLEEGVAV